MYNLGSKGREDIDSHLKTKNFDYIAFEMYNTNMEILLSIE